MTDQTIQVDGGELVRVAATVPDAAADTVLAAGAEPRQPQHDPCAATQPDATTKRTYRSTLRSFALFIENELGLPATVGAVTLDTVLDYTAWLQDLDEETDEPRCHPRTVANSCQRYAGSRAGSR
jgi:hypothetical protein